MSKSFGLSLDDLLRVLEEMGYDVLKQTSDIVYLVREKAEIIAIPVCKVIGREKLESICEILKI